MTALPALAGPHLSRDDLSALAVDLYGGQATEADFARLGPGTQRDLLALMLRNNRILMTLALCIAVASASALLLSAFVESTFAAVTTLMVVTMLMAAAVAFAYCTQLRARQMRRLASVANYPMARK
ncbi:hypothetical protein LG293_17665 (plasmid) [Citricoccus nitrophenolicus]